MAEIVIHLKTTGLSRVAVTTSLRKPYPGMRQTPAQALALDMVRAAAHMPACTGVGYDAPTPESNGQAAIELFHAVTPMHEGKLRYADVSSHVIDAYRHACARHARERMLWLSDASIARRNRVVSSIGRGDPARQAAVQQQYSKADLLVVGKRRRSALMDFLFGSVALRVLRWSTGDVLVVPHCALAARQGQHAAALAQRGAA